MQIFLCLVSPAFMLFTAARQLLFPPPEPTAWLGYRSTLAMVNIATWKEAQGIWGRAMLASGVAGTIVGISCYYFLHGSTAYISSILANAILAAITVPWTEKKLSGMFDGKGTRKRDGEDKI